MHVTDPTPARSGRAAPLPPDERRRAILRAVQPVVLARGGRVTTRDLAEAAGVAEGTLFRVFADKASLVREAAFLATDPSDVAPELAAIDLQQPLRRRLEAVLALMADRFNRVSAWMTLLHQMARDDHAERPGESAPPGRHGPPADWKVRQHAGQELVRAQIARLMQPDADRLRFPVTEAAELFDLLLIGTAMRSATAHRSGVEVTGPSSAAVVDLFCSGVLTPEPQPTTRPEGRPTC